MATQLLKGISVIIIGGSIGGLSCALELLKYGANVRIFERSPSSLESRGAGLGTSPRTVFHFAERTENNLFLEHTGVHVVAEDGSSFHQRERGRYVTNWDLIWKHFRFAFPNEKYISNSSMKTFKQIGKKVKVQFEDGKEEECDLLVCADGAHSSSRAQLIPDSGLKYVGYFLWRGLLEEENISEELKQYFFTNKELHLFHIKNAQFVVYPVPGKNGDVTPGKRRLNWGWYYRASETELSSFLLDKEGNQRTTSVPPGYVKPELVEKLRKEVASKWPKELQKLVEETENPFIQVLYEYKPKKLVFGEEERICLIGDAGHLARPHIGAGCLLAMEDSIQLVESLKIASEKLNSTNGDIISFALKHFEKQRLPIVQQMVRHGQEIGDGMMGLMK